MGTYLIRETYKTVEEVKKDPKQEADWKRALQSGQPEGSTQESVPSRRKDVPQR